MLEKQSKYLKAEYPTTVDKKREVWFDEDGKLHRGRRIRTSWDALITESIDMTSREPTDRSGLSTDCVLVLDDNGRIVFVLESGLFDEES